MIRLIPQHAAGKPTRWVLCFYRRASSELVNRLVPGRYKHVSAFGYIAEMDCWVFFDCRRDAIDLIAARGDGAVAMMDHYSRDSDMLGIDGQPSRSAWFRVGFWCVPAVKHLIGLRSGALRPDALWRDCIRNGATEIDAGQQAPGLPSAAGPDVGCAAETGHGR